MKQPPPDYNADFLLTVLRELAEFSQKVLAAGSAGDELATRAAIDQMRQLFAELQGIGQETKQQVDDAPAHAKEEIAKLLESIYKSNAFISAWCDRYNGIQTQAQLALTPEGRNAIIDRLIPPTWNWKLDILTANDDVDPALIKTAIERGQKRVVVFCVSKPNEEERIPDVHYLTDKKQASIFFQMLDFGEAHRSVNLNTSSNQKNDSDDERTAIYAEFHVEFTAAWKSYLVNKNTIRFFGRRWLMQGLENLPTIAERATFSSLREKFINTPMVIISPGPSLDKNVHQLKLLKGKALLMAPAQGALALSRAGVIPDIIVVADPADFIYVLDGFPMEQVDALLIGVSCHPKFYEKYKKKIITFNANAGIDVWISDIFHDTAHIGSGGSVSTDIFTMGLYLQCNPIVLVGQDLALTNGKQYASASADGKMSIKLDAESGTFTYGDLSRGFQDSLADMAVDSSPVQRMLTIPGYYGGVVQTKPDYAMFHSEFENLAARENAKESPIRLLNCTEGGAFIKGFEHIPLHEAITQIGDTGRAREKTSDIMRVLQNSVDASARKKLLYQRLKRAQVSLEKSHQLALRCAKTATGVQRSNSKVAKLSKVENELAKAIQDSAFLALANQVEIADAIQLGSRAKTMQQSLAASGILHNLVIREVPVILPLVDAALMKLDPFADD